jgi:hypothetical protein
MLLGTFVTLGSFTPQTRAAFLAMIGQPVGQASRNLKYTPDLCYLVRDLARQGTFPEGWALEADVTLETLRLWGRRYPEFAEAMTMARLALLDFWTRDLVRNLGNPQARPGMYSLVLRRFPALYGANPIDLAEWLTAPEEPIAQDATDAEERRIR